MNIIDCHTHKKSATDAIINAAIGDELSPNSVYSIGIHPWESENYSDITTNRIITEATAKQIVAIGETGMDVPRAVDLDCQRKLFIKHIEASEAIKKPIILHVVKAWQHITALHKELRPSQTWIAHGFRGKPEMATELIRHGIHISLSERFNDITAKRIPDDFLLVETDESNKTIGEIIGMIAKTRNTTEEKLTDILRDNVNRIFSLPTQNSENANGSKERTEGRR